MGWLRHSRVGAGRHVPTAQPTLHSVGAAAPLCTPKSQAGRLCRAGQPLTLYLPDRMDRTSAARCAANSPLVPLPIFGVRPPGTCSGGVCSAGSLGSSCRRRRCRAGGGRSPGHAGTTRLAGWHRSPVRGAGRRPSSHLLKRDPRTSAQWPPPLGPPLAPAAVGARRAGHAVCHPLTSPPQSHSPRGHPRCALRPIKECPGWRFGAGQHFPPHRVHDLTRGCPYETEHLPTRL